MFFGTFFVLYIMIKTNSRYERQSDRNVLYGGQRGIVG